MNLSFADKNLQELFETGQNRKYRGMQPHIVRKFVKCIYQLQSAPDIQSLWLMSGLRFEKLKGYENRFSIRVQDKYRLEFDIDFHDETLTIGDIIVHDLSTHYQ